MISIRKLIFGLSLIPIIALLVTALLVEDKLNSRLMAACAIILATINYHNLKNKTLNDYEQF